MPMAKAKAHSSPNSHGAWHSMRMLRWSTMQQLVLGGMMGGTWSEVGSTNLVGTCPARWPLHYSAETIGKAQKQRRDFIARRELFLALAISLSFSSFSFSGFGKCPWDPDHWVWIFGRGRQKVHQVGVNRQRLKGSVTILIYKRLRMCSAKHPLHFVRGSYYQLAHTYTRPEAFPV